MIRRHRWIIPASFLILPLLVYCTFVILPTLNSLYYSFTDWVGYGSDFDFVGFANFEKIFTDRLFSNAIKNTAIWLVLAMTAPTLLGLSLALGLQGKRASIPSTSRCFICRSACRRSSSASSGNGYTAEAGHRQHLLARDRTGPTGDRLACQPEHGALCRLRRLGMATDRLDMVIFLAGLTSVPTPLVEAAKVDGANYWQTLRKVVIPMLRPAMVVVLALTAINALKSFEVIWVMTKAGPSTTLIPWLFLCIANPSASSRWATAVPPLSCSCDDPGDNRALLPDRLPPPRKYMIRLAGRLIDAKRMLGFGILYFLLTIMLIVFMVPVYGAIVTAFKTLVEVSAGGYWTLPTNLDLRTSRG